MVRFVIFSILVSAAVYASDIPDNYEIGSRITDLATRQEYHAALNFVDSLRIHKHHDTYLLLLRLTVLVGQSLDYEDFSTDDRIKSLCDSVIFSAQKLSSEHPTSAYPLLYIGMAQMYKSIVEYREGSWFSSLKLVKSGGDHFAKGLQLDSSCVDLYYGYGMYEYHLSTRAGVLRAIGLIQDNREKGIRHIQIAAEKGILTRISAQNSLAWINFARKDYNSSIEISRKLLERYPGVRAFQWILGKSLIESKRWIEAIENYDSLLQSIRSLPVNNHHNEISCLKYLMEAYSALNSYGKVVSLGEEALSLNLSDTVKDRKKNDLKSIRELLDKSKKELKN